MIHRTKILFGQMVTNKGQADCVFKLFCFFLFLTWSQLGEAQEEIFRMLCTGIYMTQYGDCSALWHLPALYNKRNYCIPVQVYLFVPSPSASFRWLNRYAYLNLGVLASCQLHEGKEVMCNKPPFSDILRNHSK